MKICGAETHQKFVVNMDFHELAQYFRLRCTFRTGRAISVSQAEGGLSSDEDGLAIDRNAVQKHFVGLGLGGCHFGGSSAGKPR